MNTLSLDTSDNTVILVTLRTRQTENTLKRNVNAQKAQAVLSLIDELLHTNGLATAELDAIEVNMGPGSFTGLRVGVAVANTLGTVLQIPINGRPVGETVEPVYQ